MVKVKDLKFDEPKKLPKRIQLKELYGIDFDAKRQQFDSQGFEKKLNNSIKVLPGGTYALEEFVSDYYRLEFSSFKRKFRNKLKRTINSQGYLKGVYNQGDLMPVRNLVFYANKERKFVRELGEGRERGNWVKTIHYETKITTSETEVVREFINKVIRIEKLRSNDIIMLKYLKLVGSEEYSIYKIFKSMDVRQKQALFHRINAYGDGFFGKNEDYSEDVDRLELDVIKAISGGCNKREFKSNDASKRIIHPKASNNNCFFKCIQAFIPSLVERISIKKCNEIRQLFKLNADVKIDVKSALVIFKHYQKDNKYGLEIWSKGILVGSVKGKDTLKLQLEDEHYSIIQMKRYQYCKDCGRKYITKHTCNTNMKVYKKITEGKKRYVINTLKRDKYNYDKGKNGVVVVHYDIETHTRNGTESMRVHTPYIVGYVNNLDTKFKYFTGSDCMEQFIRHLFTYKSYSKVYLNAFNGSKFDHYEFVNKLNKLHKDPENTNRDIFKLDQLVMNNGSILKAVVGNIECFDISKHITGTLRENLKEMNCTTQKGEFNYDLGDDWSNILEYDQKACIRYLEGDVLGLQELSEKLNETCYAKFKVNLYKYLSTSQLTYSVWVNHLYSAQGNPIYLQSPEQELFFRQSIFGGRTYKYKHRFVSKQREDYLNKQISFDEIDDYLIDADVNSLYPAAMKYEFPVGVPKRLKENSPSAIYFNEFIRKRSKCPKVGIYHIEYITNKQLIDAILPRREEGYLKWDLLDSGGIYNSVDIDNALSLGYRIKIIDGYYWESTEPIFDNYIEFLYKFKKKANKSSAEYTLAKLMMNGLYGKTIQRPILDEHVIIHTKEEFIKYHIKYGGVEMRIQSDGSYYLTYQDEDKLKTKITKPCYLGSFILGYSRKIMLDYLQKTNPYFNSNQLSKQMEHSPFYTDTDSIQIHCKLLSELKLNKEIGGISDDLGDNCKILYGGWIAPKLYFLEYVEKSKDGEKVKYHLKGKGIPKEQLTLETFESMMQGKSIQIKMRRDFKRIHVNRNSKQKQCENFSILKLDALIKSINKEPWKGRKFIGNCSVPLYHQAE